MSRSFKKTPRSGDKKNRFMKRYANRRFRRKPIDDELIFNHNLYRKDFCSYSICDYETVGISFEHYYQQRIKSWYKFIIYTNEPFPTLEQCKEEYDRWFKRK